RHALALSELADPDPGAVPDLHEQRDLACRDADRVQLAPQLPVDLEHYRAQGVRQLHRIRYFVVINEVNYIRPRNASVVQETSQGTREPTPAWPGVRVGSSRLGLELEPE